MLGIVERMLRVIQYLSPNPFLVSKIWRLRGVTIGNNTCIYRNVSIDTGNGKVTIGDDCVLTGCTILTHDASTNGYLGINYGSPSPNKDISIGNKCFIGYGAIVLMGVNIGNDVIVGAGSVVTKDIPDGSVAVGNPAKVICTVSELVEKRIIEFEQKK